MLASRINQHICIVIAVQYAMRTVTINNYSRIRAEVRNDGRRAIGVGDNGRVAVLTEYRVGPITVHYHSCVSALVNYRVSPI